MRSTIAKGLQKQASHQTTSGSQDKAGSQEGRASRTSMIGPTRYLGNPEKRELKEKPHQWIEARVKHLNPTGYMEEINSFRYFGRNAGCFMLEIIAIADWGLKFMDAGLNYPIPVFPQYLFTKLPKSCKHWAPSPHQAGPTEPPRRSRDSWTWLVAVLQFWGDEASIANSVVYGGHERPICALAEYVLNTINWGLEPECWITYDDIVIRMPWLSKRLHGMTAGQEKTVWHQALPAPGKSSELELALERRYSEYVLNAPLGRGKAAMGKPSTPGSKPLSSPPRLTKAGRGDSLKLRLKKSTQKPGWTHVEPKDMGPDVGQLYLTPKETSQQEESMKALQPNRSPLTNEFLAPGEELTKVLDYEDVEQTAPGPDPEIVKAAAHIPKANAWADVEMQESNPPPGFEPKVSKSRYDISLVCTDPTRLGSASLVTVGEDKMLNKEVQSKAPGASRPGNDNPDCPGDIQLSCSPRKVQV